MKKTALITSLLLIYSFFAYPKAVLAQQVSLIVSPPRFEIEGKPGEVIEKIIKVTNNSDTKELILKSLIADFIVQDDLGTPIKVPPTSSGRYLASPWFTTDRDEIVLAPKAQDQLLVRITIPKDALPGGHYAGIFFEPVATKGLKTTVSYTATQVGSLFGITIAGDIKYDALIKEFKTNSPFYEFGPVDFSATIENQSDTHIRPKSKITIYDMVGRKVFEKMLDEVNIFPFTSRSLKATWDQIWGFGRYRAELSVLYSPGGNEVHRTLLFWILPYRLILAIGVIVLVLITIAILTRRHLKHREDKRDEIIDELKRKTIEMENKQH